MEIRFKNASLEKIYAGTAVSSKPRFNDAVLLKFCQRIELLKQLNNSNELRQFKSLNFEALKGDKKGHYSIRVDIKYRLEFSIEKDRITKLEVI